MSVVQQGQSRNGLRVSNVIINENQPQNSKGEYNLGVRNFETFWVHVSVLIIRMKVLDAMKYNNKGWNDCVEKRLLRHLLQYVYCTRPVLLFVIYIWRKNCNITDWLNTQNVEVKGNVKYTNATTQKAIKCIKLTATIHTYYKKKLISKQ